MQHTIFIKVIKTIDVKENIMKHSNESQITQLSDNILNDISGAGFFYELGAFFAQQANIRDALHRQYGNTNRNHW